MEKFQTAKERIASAVTRRPVSPGTRQALEARANTLHGRAESQTGLRRGITTKRWSLAERTYLTDSIRLARSTGVRVRDVHPSRATR